MDLPTGWEHIANILCKRVSLILEVSNTFQRENRADWDDKTCPIIKTLKEDLVLVPRSDDTDFLYDLGPIV